jgi:hypothetical protein
LFQLGKIGHRRFFWRDAWPKSGTVMARLLQDTAMGEDNVTMTLPSAAAFIAFAI